MSHSCRLQLPRSGTLSRCDAPERRAPPPNAESTVIRQNRARPSQGSGLDYIVGNSAALRRILDEVGRVAATDFTVLVTGETGSGKGLIARAIHEQSLRAQRPFVRVSCATLVPGLVESELFGHERGAFTGALQKRVGRFATAHRGTIFFDEIGEMSRQSQASLLNVLEEKEFAAVGSSVSTAVDVRVIAATNIDIGQAIAAGMFRSDLFYRLNVMPISVPPLRDRIEDIPLLSRYLLTRVSKQLGRRFVDISDESLHLLADHNWPGNVRELRNVVERAALSSPGATLEVAEEMLDPNAKRERHSEALEVVEREHILNVLARVNWRIEGDRGAACILEMHPSTLRSRMKKLRIERIG